MRSIYKSHSVSLKMLTIYLSICTGLSLIQLGRSTNKLVLLAAFIYVIFAIYYYYQWSVESEMAAYTPNFSKYDLDKTKRFHLTVNVESKNGTYLGKLTNLDENSLFVRFEKPVQLGNLESIELTSNIDSVEFKSIGRICTYFDQGYGIVISDINQGNYSWKQFYQVISERSWA